MGLHLLVPEFHLPAQGGPVAITRHGRRGLEGLGRVRDRVHAQNAPVAAPRDAHGARVDVAQALHVLGPGDGVLEVAAAPIFVVRLLEGLAVARAAANVGEEHDVAALNQVLHVRLEVVEELERRAAVNVN